MKKKFLASILSLSLIFAVTVPCSASEVNSNVTISMSEGCKDYLQECRKAAVAGEKGFDLELSQKVIEANRDEALNLLKNGAFNALVSFTVFFSLVFCCNAAVARTY